MMIDETRKLEAAGRVVLAAGLIGALASCHGPAGARAPDPQPAEARRPVATAQVRRSAPDDVLDLPAEVVAYRRALLHARIAGYVDRVLVDTGDHVRKGQALVLIASPELAADVNARRADLQERQRRAERVIRLQATGITSEQDLERARADAEMSKDELARVVSMKGYSVVRAPFDGVITARLADEGTLTASSGEAGALLEVSDLATVRVRVQVPDMRAHAVTVGLPLEIQDPGGRLMRARVDRVSDRLDLATRSMVAEATLRNDGASLFPGQYVRVTIHLPGTGRLGVPPEALMLRNGKTAVAVLRDGHAHVVPVQPGEHRGSTVDLLGGVAEGDLVILHPGDSVRDGAPLVASAR